MKKNKVFNYYYYRMAINYNKHLTQNSNRRKKNVNTKKIIIKYKYKKSLKSY